MSVLTGQPNYPEGTVLPGYKAWSWGAELHPAGYSIFRVPLVPRRRGRALNLVLNYLSFIASTIVLGPWVLRGQPFDVVFVYGTSPILQAIGALWLGRLKRARVVTWVQDLWPQSLEVTGFVRNRRLLQGVEAVVRWIYRRNDLLLVQSPAFVPAVAALAGGTPVEVHPNPGELAFESAATRETPALTLDPGFNIVFAGNLGNAQAVETVIEAATLLRDEADLRFVLIGSGARREWLLREVAARRLGNVQLPGRFPPEAMPGILSQASALLVSLARSPIMSLTVPSKVQAYLAAGRPVIASLDGEGARVVTEAGAGVTAAAEDAPALAAAVRRLQALLPAQREAFGAAGIAYYRAHFRPRALAKRLARRLRDVAGPGQGSEGGGTMIDPGDGRPQHPNAGTLAAICGTGLEPRTEERL